MKTKPAPTPAPAPSSIPTTAIQSRRESIITIRDQLRMQLNGVENQLYILDQLLSPDPDPEPAPTPSPEGTI